MSHCNIIISLTLILLLVSYTPCFEARTKLLKNMEEKKIKPFHYPSLLVNSLQKGDVPPSSPTDKGHKELGIVKHFNVDHNMGSVPSFGIGN